MKEINYYLFGQSLLVDSFQDFITVFNVRMLDFNELIEFTWFS